MWPELAQLRLYGERLQLDLGILLAAVPGSAADRRMGHPRCSVIAHRSVGEVRHQRGAEQERQENQPDQLTPHDALPSF
jgi:hypothetical protein